MELIRQFTSSDGVVSDAGGKLGDGRDDDWRSDEATNQTIFREMNEWTVDDADARVGEQPETDLYLCECGDATCTDPIELSRTEYEAVRSVPVRFAIAVNHENPEVDLLVSESKRYSVVDKIFGAPARIAFATNPRK